MRGQHPPAVPFLDAHRLQHLDELARLRQFANARLVDGGNEAGGTAIHDRHFAGIDLDETVVDVEASQGRQQVLDGAHRHSGIVAEHGAQGQVFHRLDVGRNIDDDASAPGDQKPKAGIWLRRMQHQAHGRTTVHPRASQLNFMSDSGLARPYKSPGHVSLDPLIGPGRRPFQRPVPPKIPPQLPVFYETWSFFALTLDRRLNQTILECADWGQITVSYTVLPLRRSFGTEPAPRLSTAFATPKKHRQINLIIERWARLRGAHGALLAPTTGRLGEPPQQSECAGLGRGIWLP